jgi:hypothetical protein
MTIEGYRTVGAALGEALGRLCRDAPASSSAAYAVPGDPLARRAPAEAVSPPS